jgi:hypothetical protein
MSKQPPPPPPTTTAATHKWRFGYGSNLGLKTLREKKNLSVDRYHVGIIKGYELCKILSAIFLICCVRLHLPV